MTDDLVFRLRERARIRRQIPGRKSVESGEPDRIADLLDEAANALLKQKIMIEGLEQICESKGRFAKGLIDLMAEHGINNAAH